MRWQLPVALRLLGIGRAAAPATAARLATTGVAAGVATLIVVLAVMNGFQSGTIESLLELSSFHLRVEPSESAPGDTTIGALSQVADRIESVTGVEVAVATVEMQTLARGFWPEAQAVQLRGVPGDWLERDAGARTALETISGDFALEEGNVVLGSSLARALGVRVGDPVSFTHLPLAGGSPADVELLVSGVVRSGYLAFDSIAAFVGLETAAAAFGGGDQPVVGVKLRNEARDREAVERIAASVAGVERTVSWREYNRGIFGALRAEKSMMVALVTLMFVVVSGTIFQIQRRAIVERSEEIAILVATGARPTDVRSIFELHGWIIGVIGTAAGTLAGILIAINVGGLFRIAAAFVDLFGGDGSMLRLYDDVIPVRMVLHEIVLVASGAIAVCVVVTILAARSVVAIRPAVHLRAE